MALIAASDVQAWITTDRLLVDASDLSEEPNVSAEVLAKVSVTYDVSAWVSTSTTPNLIKSVISARVAAIRYSKHYADQLDELLYADWLNNWVISILEGIINGSIPLLDTVTDDELTTAQVAASVKFFPTDISSADDANPPKFTMAQEF